MDSTTIVGYTYQAELLCPACTLREVEANNEEIDPELAVDWSVEDELNYIAAEFLGIDRSDESSFDSSVFPKVVFPYQIEGLEHCEECADYEWGEDQCCAECGEPLLDA